MKPSSLRRCKHWRDSLAMWLTSAGRWPTLLRIACGLLWLAMPASLLDAQQPSNMRPTPQGRLLSSGTTGSEVSLPSYGQDPRPTLPAEAWTQSPRGTSASPASAHGLPAAPAESQTATPQVIPAGGAVPLGTKLAAAAAADGQSKQATRTRTPLEPPSKPDLSTDDSTGSGGTLQMLLSVGSSLLIVIGLFLGTAWCYRRTLNTSMGSLPKQVVQVLGRTALAPRQQLMVVRFGSKLVLVSLVQGEARTLSEITDPLEVDQLAGMCESSQPGSISNSFRNILNQGGPIA